MTIINNVTYERLLQVIHGRQMVFGPVAGALVEDEIRRRMEIRFGKANVQLVNDNDKSNRCDFLVYDLRVESKSIEQSGLVKRTDGSWIGRARIEHTRKGGRTLSDGSIVKTIHVPKNEIDIITISLHNITDNFDYIYAYPPELPSATCKEFTAEQNQQLIPTHLKIDSKNFPPGVYHNFEPILEKIHAKKVQHEKKLYFV
jgi:hypothetical protein